MIEIIGEMPVSTAGACELWCDNLHDACGGVVSARVYVDGDITGLRYIDRCEEHTDDEVLAMVPYLSKPVDEDQQRLESAVDDVMWVEHIRSLPHVD